MSKRETDFHVVGVGASAGGLEALEQLFANFQPPTGVAFVVLQHLSPDFESRMDELLRRQTDMEVEVVVDGVTVEPDHIYLIPPKKEMVIANGRLLLTNKDPSRGLALPIDHFLRSMANDLGPRASAVILSGSGSDGSRGVIEVAEAGGLVICQDPKTARFESMPRSAQATGVVHLSLAPERIPEVLVRYAESGLGPQELADSYADEEPRATRELVGLLREAYGIDFSDYKANTVERRVERRMSFAAVGDIDRYVELLREDRDELDTLYHDLLIGVTQFFRDPEVFRTLEREVIPALFDAAADRDEELRVWVAGCATGEEAYSVAILLLEERRRRKGAPPIRVFATDVHRASLEAASLGRYSESALANVSAEHRGRWFTPIEEGYQVKPELRRVIVFAPHDAIVDAPFTRLDLVTCRNLLIYLQPSAQRRVLSSFVFGLRMGGVLLLGSSERPGEHSEAFDTLDSRRRLYRKNREVRASRDLQSPPAEPRPRRTVRHRAAGGNGFSDPRLIEIYDLLLRRHMPPALLVDEDYQLLHSFGGAEKHVRIPPGRPSRNILDLVQPVLKTTVYGALQHAEKRGQSVRYVGPELAEGEAEGQGGEGEQAHLRYDVVVEPVNEIHSGFAGYLVILEPTEIEAKAPAEVEAVTEATDRLSSDYISSLEDELRYTRENLQATVEELQASNEELQASNEELQASNEELQSTNEELHSVNEELYTVNAEHQRKIDELTQVNRDIDNLLHASEVAVVFLDSELHIRRFTSLAADLFGLIEHDVGREFTGFAMRMGDVDLLSDLQRAVDEGTRVAREVRDRKGNQHVLRILPYEAEGEDDRPPGVLVSLVDIEELKASEARVERLSSIVESSEDAIASLTLDGEITSWNRGAEQLLGWPAAQAEGGSFIEFVAEAERSAYQDKSRAVHKRGETETFNTKLVRESGEVVDVALTVAPSIERGQLNGTSVIARDLRDHNRAQARVRDAVRQRESFIAMLSHELRNPLAALLHASRVLDEDVGEDARDAAKGTIRRQVDHMGRLLDDLLDVSRIRRGQIEMRFERTRLGDLVERAREAVAAQIDERGLELHVELDDPDLVAFVDPGRMQQVLLNLLSNAVKFSPRGRPIHLRAAAEDGELVVRVRDEGQGLREKEVEDIFEPFAQGDYAGLEHGGLGLGLALVRSIVEAHDGAVTASSPGPGRGSEFVVCLPLPDDQSEVDEPRVSSSARSGVRASAVGLRVVLVEDDDDGRAMLATLLRTHGFEVSVAADGAEGLSKIMEEVPDVALVDIGLPRMSGYEVGRRVRERYSSEELRLVALTGYGQQNDRQAVFDAGFDFHLVKPVDTSMLESVVLGGAEQARELN